MVIKGADLLVTNQTFACWLALGMATPMIEETWNDQPNSMLPRANAIYARDGNEF